MKTRKAADALGLPQRGRYLSVRAAKLKSRAGRPLMPSAAWAMRPRCTFECRATPAPACTS